MNGARKISNTKAFEEQKSNILYDMVVALKVLNREWLLMNLLGII